jgi:HEPN domain-containing protein
MQDKTKVWISLSEEDLKASSELLEFADLPKAILFHCQQSVEKILKAVLEEYDLRVPKIHNIEELYRLMPDAIKESLNISLDHLSGLSDIYIDTRYPSDLGLLPTGLPTKEDAEEIFQIASDIVQKIKTNLEG